MCMLLTEFDWRQSNILYYPIIINWWWFTTMLRAEYLGKLISRAYDSKAGWYESSLNHIALGLSTVRQACNRGKQSCAI